MNWELRMGNIMPNLTVIRSQFPIFIHLPTYFFH